MLAALLAWGGSGLWGTAQALYLATSWASISRDLTGCTVLAREALASAGLTRGGNVSGSVVYADDGQYLASVVCAAENDTLFVSVAGPDGKRAQALAEAVRTAFLEAP